VRVLKTLPFGLATRRLEVASLNLRMVASSIATQVGEEEEAIDDEDEDEKHEEEQEQDNMADDNEKSMSSSRRNHS
jgi:hypothetical protein